MERERADEAQCTVSEKEVLLKSLAEAKERSDRHLSQKCSEVTSQLAVAREDIVSKIKLVNKKEAELTQVGQQTLTPRARKDANAPWSVGRCPDDEAVLRCLRGIC